MPATDKICDNDGLTHRHGLTFQYPIHEQALCILPGVNKVKLSMVKFNGSENPGAYKQEFHLPPCYELLGNKSTLF